MHYWMGSLLAVAVGFVLDLLLGDPNSAYHPICLIGRLIAFTEKKTRALFPKTKTGERTAGGVTALIVVLISTGIPALLLVLAYHLSFAAGVLAEAVVCYFVLATKSLKKESMNVKKALEQDGLEAGRKMVSRIVGRDTQNLTKQGVIKAAVETVAENYSDGVAAPLLYMILGGGAAGFFYKSIAAINLHPRGLSADILARFSCSAIIGSSILVIADALIGNIIGIEIQFWILCLDCLKHIFNVGFHSLIHNRRRNPIAICIKIFFEEPDRRLTVPN